MILAPLFFLAAAASAQPACPDVVTPEAMICRALRAQAAENPGAAAENFEQAAMAATDSDPQVPRLWAAAGNMWLAAGEEGRAAAALDKALASPLMVAEQRGETLLDRARVAEAQGDLATARTRFDEAVKYVGSDPFAWYFGAALAIREGDGTKATAAIGKALTLAPGDPTLLFEAGHVAQLNGDDALARKYWAQAIAADPAGPFGKAARAAMDIVGQPLVTKDDPSPK